MPSRITYGPQRSGTDLFADEDRVVPGKRLDAIEVTRLVEDVDEDLILFQYVWYVVVGRREFTPGNLVQPGLLAGGGPVVEGLLKTIQQPALDRILEDEIPLLFPLLPFRRRGTGSHCHKGIPHRAHFDVPGDIVRNQQQRFCNVKRDGVTRSISSLPRTSFSFYLLP